MSPSARQGFTLLELLIAVSITALLVTAAVQAYISISRAQERALGGEKRDRAALVLLDRIERELAGTLLLVKGEDEDRLGHPYLFIGEDRVFGTQDSDAIRFITLTPARAAGERVPGGIRMVSYSVEPGEGESLSLVREERVLPEGMEKRISVEEGQVVMERLSYFRLRFRDDETGDWRERWDSTDIALLDRLPEAVEISVRLQQRNLAGEVEEGLEQPPRVVPLRMRPFNRDSQEQRSGPGNNQDSDDDDDSDEEDDDFDGLDDE